MGTCKPLIIRLRLWLIRHADLTNFEKDVLIVVADLKHGKTITYQELAKKIGRPKAYRAVGNALSKNPFPLIIPCHRVVGKSSIGGYKLGRIFKSILLTFEKTLKSSLI